MPKRIKSSLLQKYVSKIKNSNKQIRTCNRAPKTSSFDNNNSKGEGKLRRNDAATLSDIDQFLYENFRSLYQKEEKEEDHEHVHEHEHEHEYEEAKTETASFVIETPRLVDPPNLVGSARFFVSSDEASTSSSVGEGRDPTDFIALLTYSPSPYEDFRMSMEEMVEARLEHNNGRVDWEFMEELLFCYMDLNNKKSYRYILKAFVDLVLVLRTPTDNSINK